MKRSLPSRLARIAVAASLAAPLSAQVTPYGPACPGASGIPPSLSASGILQQGQPMTLTVTGAPLKPGILGFGTVPLVPGLPLDGVLPGCSLHLVPMGQVAIATGSSGTWQTTYVGTPPGLPILFQALVLDTGPTTIGGMTNGLSVASLPPSAFSHGDLVITEIHRDPAFVADAKGEWIEVYNATEAAIDLEGWTLSDDGGDSHVIANGGLGVLVPAGAYRLLGAESDPFQNGGTVLLHEYAGFTLDDAADEIELFEPAGILIDRVAYANDGVWPAPTPGVSLSLSSTRTSAVANDDGAKWCAPLVSVGWLGANPDLASPALANADCGCLATDEPDALFLDDDCDGIDGDADVAVFVDHVTGNDANAGTMAAPVKSVQEGIDRAFADPLKHDVYVSAGTYLGGVVLKDGVSVYGGFSATGGWQRSLANVVVIRDDTVSDNRLIAAQASGIAGGLELGWLTLSTIDAPGTTGASTYGLHVSSSSGIALESVSIAPGKAGNGAQGAQGATGADGADGGAGSEGSCDSSFSAPGGNGGTDPHGYNGGKGGNGGIADTGTWGAWAPLGGGAGGAPGEWGSTGFDADWGTSGADGTMGAHALQALNGGMLAAGFWVSTGTGNTGATGSHGRGGGGGGGGGGQWGPLVDDGTGNGGGGGGAGGCPGQGGLGGKPGGGSFGLVAISSHLTLLGGSCTSGNGGAGGAGGRQGFGGDEGGPGAGATECMSQVGAGGGGGYGGLGGLGGHGSGGGGGPSYAILKNAPSTVQDSGTFLQTGAAGAGGPVVYSGQAAGLPGETALVKQL